MALITGDDVPRGEARAGFVVIKCQCSLCRACDLYWIGSGGRAYSLGHARAAGWITRNRRWYCRPCKEHGTTYDDSPQPYDRSPTTDQLELKWP
jgi:hypothetical protein